MVPSPQGSLEKGSILDTSLWTPAEPRWEKKQEFRPNRAPSVGGHWARGDRETAPRSSPPAAEKCLCPRHPAPLQSGLQQDHLVACFQGRTVTAVTGDWPLLPCKSPELGAFSPHRGMGWCRGAELRKPFCLRAGLAGCILRKLSKGRWPVDSARHLGGAGGGVSWPRGGQSSPRWFPEPGSSV